MTVATVSPLAQLALQLGVGVCVNTAITGALGERGFQA